MVNTIVTAFINISNGNRKLDDYIKYGKYLLNIDVEQIMFIERDIFYKYFNYNCDIHIFNYEGKDYEYTEIGNKTFVFFEKKDNYLYNYTINRFSILTDNPTKDTIDYMFIQCHKTEWIRMASKLKERSGFIWVDFGIHHMIKEEERPRAYKEIERIVNKPLNNIRIASWYGLQYPAQYDIYERPLWYFAGSVFGGPLHHLVEFSKRMKEKCIKIISEKETIMWEINIWYMVYKDYPALFDDYMCRNDLSILFEF